MGGLPTRDELLAWIAGNPGLASKRDIARAFGLKGAERVELKRLLRELAEEGQLEKRRRSYRDPERLPPVAVLEVTGPDAEGDLWARPLDWTGEGARPRILLIPRAGDPALGRGERILARLTEAAGGEGHSHEARLIRRIALQPRRLLGIYRAGAEGGRIVPIDKGAQDEWLVRPGDASGAEEGELVEAEQAGPKSRLGLPRARVVERLGDPAAPRAVSLIAIHAHGIPDAFPETVLAQAEAVESDPGIAREDLREIPLLTIDPADARDHDDAVFAQPDDDPGNPGGHVLWVAIADVAAHVRPGSVLDREARNRGNSTYFPDRVVPMLPERLSADLCSLIEGADRPVIAVRMVLDAEGNKLSHRFVRALMRSAASLTYEQVQAAQEGRPDDATAPLLEPVIRPLYAAYAALEGARRRRQPLDLDLPERQIVLSPQGRVTSVAFKERLDAHRLIEDCMVLANVAAAETLERRRRPLLYRVHEAPAPEKLDALRDVVEAAGLTLAKGQVLRTAHLNRLLAQAAGTEQAEIINMSVLRSMTQAYYAPENLGHFGLHLRRYAHFTSPIRRYSDLVVHRALIAAHGWGPDGLNEEEAARLTETAEHISMTERRSMAAERDTTDRYLAAWLSDRVGAEFAGRIAGIARFGVFVRLAESGAEGFIPISTLGREYFHYDRDSQTLMGEHSGLTLGLGTPVLVRLAEAVPVTGGLILELLEVAGATMPRGPQRSARGGPRRKLGKHRQKAQKLKRKSGRRPG